MFNTYSGAETGWFTFSFNQETSCNTSTPAGEAVSVGSKFILACLLSVALLIGGGYSPGEQLS